MLSFTSSKSYMEIEPFSRQLRLPDSLQLNKLLIAFCWVSAWYPLAICNIEIECV